MLRNSLNLGRVAALLALSGSILLADGAQTGTVAGTVKDPSGAVLAGVKLQMRGENLQGVRTTTTNAKGDYRFLLLPPGRYSLTAELDGYNTVRVDLTASVNLATTLNIPMGKIGTQVIEVTASATTIEQGTTTGNATVTKELVDRLPVGRTYQGAMQLTPGVTGGANPNVLGGQSSENIYLIDGVDTTDPTTGTFGLNLAEDSIQEVQVLTTGISAEFGRFNGAVSNVVTKSGTNTFEGILRYNFNNIAWNALTPAGQKLVSGQFVDNDNSTKKPESNLVKTPYITIGGPIFKDRLWYFASFQIPSTSALQATTPGPLGGGGIPFDRTFKADPFWYSAKVTWAINNDHTVAFQRTQDPAIINRVNYGSTTFLDTTTIQTQGGSFNSLTYRGILSPTLTLEGKLAQQTSELTVKGEGGSKHAFYDQANGYRQYENGPFEGYTKRPRTQGNLSLTWFPQWMGSHEVRFGVDYQKTDSKNKFGSIGNQDVYFSGFTGNVAVQGPNGLNYNMDPEADYLEVWTPLLESKTENKYTAFYINDRWAVNKHWGLNIGLRRESLTGNNDIGQNIWSYSNIAPRLGVTYDPTGDGTTTFGVTFGRYFYSPIQDGLDAQNKLAQGYDDYMYVSGDPHLRSSFSSTSVYTYNPTSDPGLRFSSDLKGPRTDETTLVLKHAASSRLSFQAVGVYKEFHDQLATRTYYEPTTNIRVRLLENAANAKRRYSGLLLSSEYTGEKYYIYANATLSRLFGNIDQTGQGGSFNVLTSGTYAPTYNTNNAEGLLSSDRTLVVKLFATRKFTWNKFYLDNGFRVQFNSGAPYQLTYSRSNSAAPSYVTPGDKTLSVIFGGVRNTNRFNDNYNVDYTATFGYDFTKRYKVFVRADITNVFNRQEQVSWNTTVSYSNTTGVLSTGSLFGHPTSINNYVAARTLLFSLGLKF